MTLFKRTRQVLAALALAAVAPVHAQALSDWTENNFIDQVFRAQTWTIAANLDVGLSSGSCSDTSFGTEMTGGNYARQSVARSLANFAGTQSAGSTTASSGTGGQTSNNVAISWGTVTWTGSVANFFIMSGANMVLCQAITGGPKTVNSGDTVQFAIGALTVTIQ